MPSAAKMLFETISFRHERQRWFVRLALLMPNHLHMLVAFPGAEIMAKTIAAFKEYTAKQGGIDWQRVSFDHRLRTGESLEEKAHYIRMNPVRAGLVASPGEWAWVWTPESQVG